MEIVFLGTGSAIPTDRRQSSLYINDEGVLIDCGAGVLHSIVDAGIDIKDVGSVLLTHLHSDHVNDVIPLVKARWLIGQPWIDVYGPPGTVDCIDSLLDAYSYLEEKIEINIEEIEPGESFNLNDMHFDTLATRHSVTSMAYKADDYFVVSGDTEPVEEIKEFSSGCKVLIHECSFPDEMQMENHTMPSGLAEIIKGIDVDAIYITHLFPQTQGHLEDMKETIESGFSGFVQFAEDHMSVEF